MQRYAAASWSGDISSTWTAMRKQIRRRAWVRDLGHAVLDVRHRRFLGAGSLRARAARSAALDEWRELATRWFQFATFVPILRVHGQAPKREMWEFGGDDSPAYKAMLKFDRLRYRLLPYIYSLAGGRHPHGGTIMRPLVMDFPRRREPHAVDDQYMFGPALMVSPVTTYKVARAASVYLPPTPGGWYDFWTGARVAGGRAISRRRRSMPFRFTSAPARSSRSDPSCSTPTRSPPIRSRCSCTPAADGAFTLYEDDGVSYGYEKGAWATHPAPLARGHPHADHRQARRGASRACWPGGRSRWW